LKAKSLMLSPLQWQTEKVFVERDSRRAVRLFHYFQSRTVLRAIQSLGIRLRAAS
jgi:hypothetical protein